SAGSASGSAGQQAAGAGAHRTARRLAAARARRPLRDVRGADRGHRRRGAVLLRGAGFLAGLPAARRHHHRDQGDRQTGGSLTDGRAERRHMEPVEINAGTCYLRAFRADDRLDDRPALVKAFSDPAMRRFVRAYRIETIDEAGDYIATRAREWKLNQRASWAIAEPTTRSEERRVGKECRARGAAWQ